MVLCTPHCNVERSQIVYEDIWLSQLPLCSAHFSIYHPVGDTLPQWVPDTLGDAKSLFRNREYSEKDCYSYPGETQAEMGHDGTPKSFTSMNAGCYGTSGHAPSKNGSNWREMAKRNLTIH